MAKSPSSKLEADPPSSRPTKAAIAASAAPTAPAAPAAPTAPAAPAAPTGPAASAAPRSSGAPAAVSAPSVASDPARPAATEPTPEAGVVRIAVYERGACREWEGAGALSELGRAIGRKGARIWIDLRAPSTDQVAAVSEILRLHPLLAEDLIERDQRAKLEQVGNTLHLALFSLGFDDGKVYEREIEFVLGERFLLSNHSAWWEPRSTRHLRTGVSDPIGRGLDYLLWALADDVIDSYFPILDLLGDEIDDLEDRVVNRADRALLERLFELKRELILIRRVTAPEREMFNILSSREESAISPEHRLYFRDAYDHLIRLTDELDTYRELASATLETYLSTVNNNLSLIMKRLTGVTVVVAGIGAIGGIFGMSEAQNAFRLDEGPGFWIVTVGSLFIAGVAAAVLHKIDWI
ncbi:MAG TPA: CorA family divalent cation transporter [Candidatus Limnocylindrales bacterium]